MGKFIDKILDVQQAAVVFKTAEKLTRLAAEQDQVFLIAAALYEPCVIFTVTP